MGRAEKVPKQARLTEAAAAGWERLCRRRGVTYTGLIEALGELLANGDDSWVPEEAIRRAREIDRQRYSR